VLFVVGHVYQINMRIPSADGTRELRCRQVMDDLDCPSRQEACTSCLHELLRVIQRCTVPHCLPYWLL